MKNHSFHIDESPLYNIFKNNITYLALTIDKNGFTSPLTKDLRENLLKYIFDTFKNLLELDFNQSNIDGRPLISVYKLDWMTYFSTSLTHLSISVKIFDDCLYIFNGHLSQLCKLNIVINQIDTPSLSIKNSVRK